MSYEVPKPGADDVLRDQEVQGELRTDLPEKPRIRLSEISKLRRKRG